MVDKYFFGWAGAEYREDLDKARDDARQSSFLVSFDDAEKRGLLSNPKLTNPGAMKPIWDLCREILGSDIPAGAQEVGDCVSWGMKQAGERRQVIEIAMGQEEKFRKWFAPWIYAVSRNQIGKGRITGDGSLGIWAAKAVQEYGVLFEDDQGVPSYSGSLARKWGSRSNVSSPEYQKFFDVAKDNPCVCVEVKSVDEAVKMVRDYRRPLTIASLRGFRMTPVEYKGYHVFVPSGTWAHQMCWIEYNDDIKALYRLNSWGASAHGKPFRNETPGGAWNLLEDIEREFKSYDCECYALVDFSGEIGPPDWRPV